MCLSFYIFLRIVEYEIKRFVWLISEIQRSMLLLILFLKSEKRHLRARVKNLYQTM